MSTNTDILPKYSIVSSLAAVVLTILFIVTACSTFNSVRQASQQKTPLDEVSAGTDAMGPAVDANESTAFDNSMDEWQKARAAYLRILDYAEINQQNNQHDEYLLKSDLVESRFHIKASETAMYVEHDYQKALQQLQVAKQRFNDAVKIATPNELRTLDNTKPNLDYLLKQTELSFDQHCIYPNLNGYQRVEAQIENLLVTL